MRSVDVLVCAALEEEIHPVRSWLKAEFKSLGEMIYWIADMKKLDSSNDSLVALCAFNEMGNVHSAVHVNRAIRDTLPKVVIMVGLAGAYSGKEDDQTHYLSTGDVGFSKSILYFSHMSFEETNQTGTGASEFESKFEAKFRNTHDIVILDKLESIASAVASADKQWISWAQKIFKENVEPTNDWQKKFQYITQNQITNDFVTKPVRIASGEALVKSVDFQNKLVQYFEKKFSTKQKLRMFEMEAYGVGLICVQYKIPFLVVKGVTDQITPEEQRKKDSNRLRAICAASGFIARVILDPTFRDFLKAVSPPHTLRRSLCPAPEVGVCHYEDYRGGPIANRLPCIESPLRSHGIPSHEAPLTRVFEGVNPIEYSKALSERFEHLLRDRKKTSTVTLFFPYSPLELLNIFRAEQPELLSEETLSRFSRLERSSWGEVSLTEKREIAELVADIIARVKIDYTHFGTLSQWCRKNLSIGFSELSKIVCRAIICNYARIDDLLKNPLYIIYPALLDICVPSLLVQEQTARRRLINEDVIFIEAPFGTNTGTIREEKVQALRFTAATGTIVLSAKECKSSDRTAVNHKVMQAIDTWKRGGAGLAQVYPRFPFKKLIETYLPNHSLHRELEELMQIGKNLDFFENPPEPKEGGESTTLGT